MTSPQSASPLTTRAACRRTLQFWSPMRAISERRHQTSGARPPNRPGARLRWPPAPRAIDSTATIATTATNDRIANHVRTILFDVY